MNEFYRWLFSLPSRDIPLIGFIIGMILIDGLNVDEQRTLAGIFIMIGETIWVNANQQVLLDNRMVNSEINRLRQEIDMLKRRMNM